jgi:hypothetical protein
MTPERFNALLEHRCDVRTSRARGRGMNREMTADPPDGHFDGKAWKKNYQREYMRRKRERLRREKAEALKKPEVGTDGSEKPSQESQKTSEGA